MVKKWIKRDGDIMSQKFNLNCPAGQRVWLDGAMEVAGSISTTGKTNKEYLL